jgi:chromosome segregation ATPase
MSEPDDDRTASLMTPAKLAQLKVRPQAAASPAAWLDQMAADAGSGHVRRLLELRQQLEAAVRAGEGELRPLATACQHLHDALARLELAQLQPRGWLARATGKGRQAAAAFAQQVERMQRAAEELNEHVKGLLRKQSAQAAIDRMLLEFGAEVRALEKIMEQGTRWLQDMRGQLKARAAEAGDPAAQQQIDEDNARCELLVERLKRLRAVVSATQQATQRAGAALAGRAGAVASVQQLLDREWKAVRQKIATVADARSGPASQDVDRAGRARKGLQGLLQQAGQDCGAAQANEQAAADELAALQAPLQAAA